MSEEKGFRPMRRFKQQLKIDHITGKKVKEN